MSSISSTGGNSPASNSLSPPPSSSTSGTGITGLNDSGISFQGLVSGLNTNQIIQGLLAVQQQEITNLQNQQAQITQHETAYNTIQANLTALQSALSGLAPTTNSVFDGRTVTSSNSDVATGSATSGSTPGVYTFTVNSLAQAQEMASQGFDSASSLITQGTFQFQVGSGAVNTITINGGNDTLQGLANAINAANAGVTATIVNDGSASQGNHLLLTANNTGTANAITITNNLAASGGGAMRPEFNATYIGNAVTGTGWSGTATPTSNTGSGTYTGSNNDTFTFTVTNGGNITSPSTTISYSNSNGTIKGTLSGFRANTFMNVAEGLQVEFNSGTVATGQTFTIKAFNPNTQAASNASITLGSGSGGLTINSATNQIQNAFNGVTLNLTGTSSTPVSLTVGNNTQTAATSIDSFVSAYNAVISYINQNDSYDAQTQQGGILLGDYNATSIVDRLGQAATSVVPGLNPSANELTAIGITVNADGTLAVNNTTLNQALSGQLPGISANDVRRLFVQDAQATNSAISYIYAPSTMQAVGSPVQVQITQAATQGAATATNKLANSTTINSSNNTFTVTVDGHTSGSITLANGTYTQAQLAQQVQSAINGNSQLDGAAVTASVNGSGDLVLTSNSYGSHSKVAIGSGNALTTLGFTGSESGTGQDVAGSFIYKGVTEAATGSGQILTSNTSNKYTGGLEVLSTLTPAQVGGSPEGSVTITQGLGAQLGNLLNQMLDPVSGQITLANQTLQNQASAIAQTITQQQQSMQQQQQALLLEFSNMESTLAQLQSAGNALNNSLTSITLPASSTSSTSGSSGTLG